jgi:MFS family permease
VFGSLAAEFPRVVLVLAAGDLVASFGFSLFFPFLTIYLVEELGASAAGAGLVVAAYSVFSIGSGLAGGWLADRFGRRPVLIGSISCTALLVVAMAFATEAWHVGLVMLLLGAIDPAFLPAARAAVADTVAEPNRPRAFGLLGVANAVGWVAGPVIGAGLSSFGYPLLFGVSGVLVGMYSLIAIRWLPETRPDPGPGSQPASGTADVPAPPDHDATARRRVFLAFLPLLAASHAATFLWVTTLPIHAAVNLGVPTQAWGLLFGLNGLLIVLFQLRISAFTETRSKPRTMGAAMACYAVGIAIVAGLSAQTAIVGLAATIVLVTVGEMLFAPIVAAFVSDLAPVARRGTWQGVALAATGIGSGIGPPVAGLILDTAPAPALWIGVAVLLALTGLGFLVLGRSADRLDTAPGPRSDGTVLETASRPRVT